MDQSRVLTTKEVADYIKVNEKTVLKLAQYGELPGTKVGDQWRFHIVAVDHYLQKQLLEAKDEELDEIISTIEHPIPMSRLTNELLIDLDLRATNKKQVMSQLARMAASARITPSYESLYVALEEREKMLSTAIGQGIALPHPRDPHQILFQKPNIIIARSQVGVDYDAPDGKKVHLFFMPCAPTQFVHIRLVAKISKLLHIPNVIERFNNITRAQDVIQILMAFEQKHLLPTGDNCVVQNIIAKQNESTEKK